MTIVELKAKIADCNDNAEIDFCIRDNLCAYESTVVLDIDDCDDEVVFNICKA